MSKSIFARLLMVLAAAFVTVHAIGCETTEGAGQDIKHAGEGISNAADRNK